jgi:hypothetical protein
LTWGLLHLKLITAVFSSRFRRAYPRFIQELEYFLAVERAEEAGHLLRDIRQQPYFEQIDILANTIHPAVFAELKKCARATSFHALIRRRSKEFFEDLFDLRRDLMRLRAFQRKYARCGELGFVDVCKIRWQIESSIANLTVAGVRFRLGYPLGEEALNRRVEYLNSVLTARVEALAPGWA